MGCLRRSSLLLLLASLAVWVFPEAEATHFRFGSMSWTSGDAAEGKHMTVTLTMVLAYRKSYGWYYAPRGEFQVGSVVDGNLDFLIDWGDGWVGSGDARVEAISEPDDYWMGTLQMTHKYEAHNNSGTPWRISFANCCRISESTDPKLNHVNNPDMYWYMGVDVDLWADGDSGDIQSPDITTLPIVYLPDNGTHSFFVGGFDRGAGAGGTLSYGFARMSEGLGSSRPGIDLDMTLYVDDANAVGTIDASTGEYTVTTTGLTKGLYSTQVVVTSDTTGLKSAVDFFIAVLPKEKLCMADCAISGASSYTSCTYDANACVMCPDSCPDDPEGYCPGACKENSPPTIEVPRTFDVSLNCTARLRVRSNDTGDGHDVPQDLFILNGVLPEGAVALPSYENADGAMDMEYWWLPAKEGLQNLCFYASDTVDFGTVKCVEVNTHANDTYCTDLTMPPTPPPLNDTSFWYGSGTHSLPWASLSVGLPFALTYGV